ncbi:MAG: hypothetical protein ACTSRW_01650 [Candidatus Helarchaeota archaeon]
MSRIKSLRQACILLVLIINMTFLSFTLFPSSQAATSWGSLLPYRYDTIYNMNGFIEMDWVFIVPAQSSTDSVMMTWGTNAFNPYSIIQTEWEKVYGTGSWLARARDWRSSGVLQYNLTGNFEWNIPYNVNRFNLLMIPLSGADLSVASLAGQTSVNISGTTYAVIDEILSFKLFVSVANPLPDIYSFQEILQIDKMTGLVIYSQTTYVGNGASGWEYTFKIETFLTPLVPILIGVGIFCGITAVILIFCYKYWSGIKNKAKNLLKRRSRDINE